MGAVSGTSFVAERDHSSIHLRVSRRGVPRTNNTLLSFVALRQRTTAASKHARQQPEPQGQFCESQPHESSSSSAWTCAATLSEYRWERATASAISSLGIRSVRNSAYSLSLTAPQDECNPVKNFLASPRFL